MWDASHRPTSKTEVESSSGSLEVLFRAVDRAERTEPKPTINKDQRPIRVDKGWTSTFSISSSWALNMYWLRRRSFGSFSSNWIGAMLSKVVRKNTGDAPLQYLQVLIQDLDPQRTTQSVCLL